MKCYLCSSTVTPYIHKNGYTIYQCKVCGLGMTDLKEKYEDFVKNEYSKGYFTGDPSKMAYQNYKDDKKYINKNLNTLLKYVKKYKKKGTLLDVGCAMGFFIEKALERAFDAYGFDASHYAITEAKKLVDGRVKVGTIQSVDYSENFFDVITLFDVFEHLADPVRDIQKLKTYLKDDGIMIIATGDSKSFIAKIMQRKWTFYNPPQHLFFFNKSILTRILTNEGFKCLEWFRINKWLSLRYVLHLARTTGESPLAQTLYSHIAHTKLGKTPLFLPIRDNMVVIVKKKV